MTQANELRIGNSVLDPIGMPKEVTIAVLLGITDDRLEYSPILLTKEILEKCGFEWEDIVTKVDGGTEKALVKSFVMMLQTVAGTWYAAPFGYPLHPSRTIYLHQLQNIFHSLTGDELIFKP